MRRKEPYLFVLIGLLILSPNLFWNHVHQWISFGHTVGLVENGGPSLKTFLEFLGPQAGILSPITFLLVIYGFWKGGRGAICHKDERYLFLFWHSIPLFGFFLILSVFSVCYVNWATPAYFTAFLMAAGVVWEATWRDQTKSWVLASALLVGATSSLLMYNLDTVRALGFGSHIPAKSLPTSRLKGWQELGGEVSKLLVDFGPEKVLIISDKRQIASELAFYVKGHPRVYTLNLSGLIKSQYDIWAGFGGKGGLDIKRPNDIWAGFGGKLGLDAMYVTKLGHHPSSWFANAFVRVSQIKQVKIYTGKELVRGYSIYHCQGFRG